MKNLVRLFTFAFIFVGVTALSAGKKDGMAKVAALSYTPAGDAPINTSQDVVDAYKRRTADALEQAIRDTAADGDVQMIVTPEFSTVGYPEIPGIPEEEQNFQNPEQARPYAEPVNGPTVQRFARLAKELNTYLIIGILESSGNDLYNTTVAMNPAGEVVASYRKINLFHQESQYVSPGRNRVFFDTPFGRVGMTICYDIHFPHPATNLVTMDHIDIMAFSTSWVGKGGMNTFRAFAKNNAVYFLAANHHYFPDTGVISPDGTIQSQTKGDGPTFGYVPMKTGKVKPQKDCSSALK